VTEKESVAYLDQHIRLLRHHTHACRKANKIKRWDQITDERKKKCACPVYAVGSFPGEGFQRKPTKQKSLDSARDVALNWLQAGDTSAAIVDNKHTPIRTATKDYLDSVLDENKDLDSGAEPTGTLKKYQTLLNQLEAFCDDKGIRFVQEIGQDEILEFKRSWADPDAGYKRTRLKKNGKPLWTTKSIGTAKRDGRTLKYFFERCIVRKWITENPAIVLKFPKAKKARTKADIKHLSPEQFASILKAVDELPRMVPYHKLRLTGLILAMRWTGLRLSDAVLLNCHDVHGDVLVVEETIKTAAPVRIPLHPTLVDAIAKLKPYEGGFYFWNRRGEGSHPSTPKHNFGSDLSKVFKKAGVSCDVRHTSHMFRNTYCVGLLDKGIPLETVALLLAHTKISTTLAYYAAWTEKSRQRAEKLVRLAWELPEGGTLER
jgi:integrase/recombinase XerD